MPQAGVGQRTHPDGDDWQPPGQAERTDQGERRQCGQRALYRQDRKLGRDQRRHLRTDDRGGASQCGDPRGDPELRVDHPAQHLHARSAIQDTTIDRPTRCLDRQMPRLTARKQPDDLQQHGHGEHPRRGARKRGRELIAASREHVHQDRRGRQRARRPDQHAVPAPEVPQAGGHLTQLTRAPPSRRRPDRFATGDRHRHFR
jgi:hypothetical protein